MNGRTNSHGSTIDDLQVPLDPCTSFRAEAGNGSVTLYWDDPVDKYATPEGETAQNPQQLVSVWDHTIVVRKVGSQPANPNDGIIVTSSGVRDQYLSTGYTDTELINDTNYRYGVFAYNTAGVASDGIFVSATPVLGSPLGNLAVGTVVKAPINGNTTEFIVVHQGRPSSMYDSSCNGTWLLLKNIYTERTWDSSNNDYKNSDIHSYLNGTFLNLFDDSIKNTIKQVKIPYQNGTGSGGSVASGANGLSCKIFLLSGYEVGFSTSDNSYFPRDGAKLSYFSSGTGNAANNKCIANYNGSATIWWLRSPITNDTDSVWYVNSDGDCNYWYYFNTFGVRPALVLPSDILVDDELNILISGSNTAA